MDSGSTQHFMRELHQHFAQICHMALHQKFMLLDSSIQLPTSNCQTFQIMNLTMVVMATSIEVHVPFIMVLLLLIPLLFLKIQMMVMLNLIKSNRCHIIHFLKATIQNRERIRPFIQLRKVINILIQNHIAMTIITPEQITSDHILTVHLTPLLRKTIGIC